MPTYRTPDVYVEEIPSFPPSVAEVGTAIPAFIGYTQKAAKIVAGDLNRKPTKIYSLKEFEAYYGLPKAETIAVAVTTDPAGAPTAGTVTEPTVTYLLYYAVKMYFDNGGAQCYIVSAATYDAAIEKDALLAGLAAVALEDEPTLIVIPEAVQLSAADYTEIAGAVFQQLNALRDRFAIFDVREGKALLDTDGLDANRGFFGNNHLKYAAAYYPFLRTTMNHFVPDDESNVQVTENGGEAAALGTLKDTKTAVYNYVRAKLKEHFVVMPPSGAVAGVYAATDAARGVWKAPANVSLADVIEPVVKLDNLKQENFNVDANTGKSINAIRAFAGKGTLVWGARTLAGNDNEWRYVSVRRFFNMVEESVKKSTHWAVFEPNDANTWVKVRGMIENYLTDKWREGALAGATPKDAFFVKCGLGTTMNPQDILEGRMNVEIGMAVVRPAEFIVLKFSHKLQTS